SAVAVAGDVLARARAFGIDSAELDAADAPALQRTLTETVAGLRERGGPVFRVIHTVRLGPHSKRDDERSAEERAALRERDPVALLAARLEPGEVDVVAGDVAAELETALARAQASPEPDERAHLNDVYPHLVLTDVHASWERPADSPRVVESL